MPQDRRSFIRRFGITLGSLIVSGSLSGCGAKEGGATSGPKGQTGKQGTPRTAQWEQLRRCWLSLSTLTEDVNRVARPDNVNTQDAIEQWLAARDAVPKKRVSDHQSLLNTLVDTGQLDEPVAQQMQVAFEEAVYHVVRSMSTCYYITPFEHGVRQDLLQQADVLRKISADLDAATVAKAQAAIAQDLAFFEIVKTGPKDHGVPWRDYEARMLKASPEALEAARLLTQLFLETSG